MSKAADQNEVEEARTAFFYGMFDPTLLPSSFL